jgi:hypothetical protein
MKVYLFYWYKHKHLTTKYTGIPTGDLWTPSSEDGSGHFGLNKFLLPSLQKHH